jgi:hypothetical protein
MSFFDLVHGVWQGLQVAPLAARWTARLLSQQEPDPELLRMCGQLLGTITTGLLLALCCSHIYNL